MSNIIKSLVLKVTENATNALTKGNAANANMLARAGPNVLLDGSVGDAVLQKSRTGTLKGTDQFGNQYYEQIDGVQHGRHRWVVYGDLQNYNTTSVPPEWHGWLHHITDDDPVSASSGFQKPMYAIEPFITKTGTSERYSPKGSFLNPQYRYKKWKKYNAWTPPGKTQKE